MDLKKTVIGIELGSTRIKAVLIDEDHMPIASGDFEWENQLVNGIWTYSMDMVHIGLHTCFARLKDDVREKYGVELTTAGAMGVSAMMHGYLPFDSEGRQLAEFRTWRNTITGEAAEELTALFDFNIPQRWSIAHLYQAILNVVAGPSRQRTHRRDYRSRVISRARDGDLCKTGLSRGLDQPETADYQGEERIDRSMEVAWHRKGQRVCDPD